MKIVYIATVLPHVDYCCTSWGSSAKIHKDKIQKLQNKYARIILNADYYKPNFAHSRLAMCESAYKMSIL